MKTTKKIRKQAKANEREDQRDTGEKSELNWRGWCVLVGVHWQKEKRTISLLYDTNARMIMMACLPVRLPEEGESGTPEGALLFRFSSLPFRRRSSPFFPHA